MMPNTCQILNSSKTERENKCTYVLQYKHTRARTRIHAEIYIFFCTYIIHIHIHLNRYAFTYTHTRTHIISARAHRCMRTYVRTYVRMYVYMYVCMYVWCMYVCMYEKCKLFVLTNVNYSLFIFVVYDFKLLWLVFF